MTTKYLDLDALAQEPDRFLRFQGIDHPIIEQTVDAFVEANKLVEELKGKNEDDYSSQVNLTVKLIRLSVPSIEESALTSRPLTSLGKIAAFVRGQDELEVQGEPVAESDSEKK